ncbi:MAG: hypothetical protein AVDCRST_MAG64-1573, partial [uncultured Phycisphaerae bacterium]
MLCAVAAAVLIGLCAPGAAGAAESRGLSVWPAELVLKAGEAHRVLVTRETPDGLEADATGEASYASDRAEVAAVEAGGVVRAVGAGTAAIR